MDSRGENKLLGLDITLVELEKCGVTLPLNSEAMREINRIAVMIQQEKLPQLISEYVDSMDKFAFYAYTACSYGDISTEQLATVLEIRSIKKLNPTHFFIEKINQARLSETHSSITEHIQGVYEAENTRAIIERDFLTKLKEKRNPDAYCIRFSFAPSEFTRQESFDSYLTLVIKLRGARVTRPSQHSDLYTITWLSAGARDALCQTIYTSNAKKVFFHHSKGIDRSLINAGIDQRRRYVASSFPGVEDATAFHELKTPIFFAILHDELHRQMISAIPNPVYDAILYTIALLRKTTSREWSPEIWRLVDMDFDPANLSIDSPAIDQSSSQITAQFFSLISGTSTDGFPLAVFLPSPYCDTTWLILMDLVANCDKWAALGINAEELPDDFKKMHQFVKNNLAKLSNTLSLPQKLFKLKCDFLGIDYSDNVSIQFSRRMKGKATYIEVLADDEPYPYKKLELINFLYLPKINISLRLFSPSLTTNESLNALIGKLSDESEATKRIVLDYLSNNEHRSYLFLILLNNLEKNQINLTMVNDAIGQIQLLDARLSANSMEMYKFIVSLEANNASSIVTLPYLKQLLSTPDNIFIAAASNPDLSSAKLLFRTTLQSKISDKLLSGIIATPQPQLPESSSTSLPQQGPSKHRKSQ